jgi:hypothetical protein
MPLDTKSYPGYPLTSGQPKPATIRIENFHQAVGLIRCFDATKTAPERRIKCDWYDRDSEFLKGAKKIPQYTDLFWALFFLVMKHYSPLRNHVLKVLHVCICMYLHVYVRICRCLYVSVRICTFLFISACIGVYLTLFLSVPRLRLLLRSTSSGP